MSFKNSFAILSTLDEHLEENIVLTKNGQIKNIPYIYFNNNNRKLHKKSTKIYFGNELNFQKIINTIENRNNCKHSAEYQKLKLYAYISNKNDDLKFDSQDKNRNYNRKYRIGTKKMKTMYKKLYDIKAIDNIKFQLIKCSVNIMNKSQNKKLLYQKIKLLKDINENHLQEYLIYIDNLKIFCLSKIDFALNDFIKRIINKILLCQYYSNKIYI